MYKVLKNFVVMAGATFINMLLGLLTTPIITRIVNPPDYGRFSIFSMYASIATMILCLGLDQAMVRYFYESDKQSYKQTLLMRCIQIPIFASIIMSIALLFLIQINILHFELGQYILELLCIYIIIQVIYRFSTLLLRLEHKTKLYSVLLIIHKLVYIIFAIPLLMINRIDHMLILVLGTILATLICTIVSIYSEKSTWNFHFVDKCTYNVSEKSLLRYAYPYIFSMGITMLFQAADQLSLNIFCTYKEVGIYASAMSLVHVFGIVQTAFNTIWAPMSLEHYTNDMEDRDFYKNGNKSITIVMFFIGITLIFCKKIFVILLGEKYREAAFILPFLIFNPIMYTISETTVSGLVFMKKSKMHVVVAIGACATNILGNVILVPRLGCRGAAISTGISYIVFFSLRTFLSNRYFYVDFSLKKFYFLTFIVSLYAMYNTFFDYDAVSIAGYVVCLFVLILLYKDTMLHGVKYFFQWILAIMKKRIHGA